MNILRISKPQKWKINPNKAELFESNFWVVKKNESNINIAIYDC